MQWSLSKMNRIEKAQTGIRIYDLRALLAFYNITDNEQIAKPLDSGSGGETASMVEGLSRYCVPISPRAHGLRIRIIRCESVRDIVYPWILQTESCLRRLAIVL